MSEDQRLDPDLIPSGGTGQQPETFQTLAWTI